MSDFSSLNVEQVQQLQTLDNQVQANGSLAEDLKLILSLQSKRDLHKSTKIDKMLKQKNEEFNSKNLGEKTSIKSKEPRTFEKLMDLISGSPNS